MPIGIKEKIKLIILFLIIASLFLNGIVFNETGEADDMYQLEDLLEGNLKYDYFYENHAPYQLGIYSKTYVNLDTEDADGYVGISSQRYGGDFPYITSIVYHYDFLSTIEQKRIKSIDLYSNADLRYIHELYVEYPGEAPIPVVVTNNHKVRIPLNINVKHEYEHSVSIDSGLSLSGIIFWNDEFYDFTIEI